MTSEPIHAHPRRTLLRGSILAAVGAGVATAQAVVQPVAAQAADAFLKLTGGTLTGSLHLRSRPGDETRDTTSRLTVESYQIAYRKPFGEGIRMMLKTANAKNMIAWYDAFTQPNSPKAIAWVGAHYGTYVPGLIHKHWSVETSNAVGELHSRFTITYGQNLTVTRHNATHVQHTASQGGRVWLTVSPAQQTKQERALFFATGVDAATRERRWGLTADTTAETGTASGSDFKINRYSNTGALLATALRISRGSGQVTIPGDVEISTVGRGVLLRSPNGTRWRVTVDNAGRLTTRRA